MHGIESRRALVAATRRRTAATRAREPLDVGEVAIRNRHIPALVVVRRRSEHVECFREAKSPRVVRRRRQVLELASIRLEAVRALRELHGLAIHLPIEAGVADDAPDVIVRAVLEVRRSCVAVANAPPRAEDLPHVRLVVPIRVLQEQEMRRASDDDAAIRKCQAGRYVEVLGEDRELVGTSVAVGILENLDAIVTGISVQDLVRIIHGLDDPEPPAFVEREGDRLDDVRLAREELDAELRGRLYELLCLVRRERQLKLGRIGTALVVRHVEAVDIGDAGHLELLPAAAPCLIDRPHDSALDQVLKAGIAPGPFVVAVRRVEDASLPLRFQPRPRLPSLCVHALHDHRASARRRRGARHGFFPRGEWLESLDDGISGLDDLCREFGAALRLQSRTDQRQVPDSVERDDAVPLVDETAQDLFLRGGQGQAIAVDHDSVVSTRASPRRALRLAFART